MTAAGASIHKVGRNKDVNRDTAKWSHDVERTLKVMGGPALVNQLKQECKKPEEMPQTRLSAHLPAYQTDVDEGFKLPPEAEAGGSSDYDKQKLSDLHMAVQQANATVESTRTLRPQGKKPEVRHDGQEVHDDWNDRMATYRKALASARSIQAIAMDELTAFVIASSTASSSAAGEDGGGASAVAASDESCREPKPQDDELYQLVKCVGQSQIQSEGTTPFGLKPAVFKNYASPLNQQGLWLNREALAKEVLLGTTLDHVNIALQSMQDTATAHQMWRHVVTNHKPLETEEISKICAQFTIGMIGEGADTIGLNVDRKGKVESYESFISRLEEEQKYILNIATECPRNKATISATVADDSLVRILKSAHNSSHPNVIQIRNTVGQLDGKNFAECCAAFRREERRWLAERQGEPDGQLHYQGGGGTRGNSKANKGKGDGYQNDATPGEYGNGNFKFKCYNCNTHCGYSAEYCPHPTAKWQKKGQKGKDNGGRGGKGKDGKGGKKGGGKKGGGKKGGGKGDGKGAKGGGKMQFTRKNFNLLQRQLTNYQQRDDASSSGAESEDDTMMMMRDVTPGALPDQLLLQNSVFNGRVCVDSGAARAATGCGKDVYHHTQQIGMITTANGNLATTRVTVAYTLEAYHDGAPCQLITVHPQANYIRPQQGHSPVRIMSWRFLQEKLGFLIGQDNIFTHPDGYQLHGEWIHGIMCLKSPENDNRRQHMKKDLVLRVNEIENAGGGFVPADPAFLTLRGGKVTDDKPQEEDDDEDDGSHDGNAGQQDGGDGSHGGNAGQHGDGKETDHDAHSSVREDNDDAGARSSNGARDGNATSAGGEEKLLDTTKKIKKKCSKGKKTGVKVTFKNSKEKDGPSRRTKKPKLKLTLPFRILRRQHPMLKRLIKNGLWVFGAPIYATLDKVDLNKMWPDRCMKLGARGLLGYFVGKPDWLSPTVWMAVPPQKGKRGQKWKVIRVSWSRLRPVEDQYVDRARDKIVMPIGRGDDIKVIHSEHEVRPPESDEEHVQKGGGASARGRPTGWTKDCGLSYEEFRHQHELESSSSEDEVDVMRAPTMIGDDEEHMLLTHDKAKTWRDDPAYQGIYDPRSANLNNDQLHFTATTCEVEEELREEEANDLYLTGDWGIHVAEALDKGNTYVKENEILTDDERRRLPPIKDVVDMFLAKDYMSAWLSIVKEVNSYKERAVLIAVHDKSQDPGAKDHEKTYHFVPLWTRKFERGKFIKNKFRGALDGSPMIPGHDCRPDIFSPTPMSATVKLLFALNATRLARGKRKMRSIDLETFFLQQDANPTYGGHKIKVPAYMTAAEMTMDEVTELHNKYLDWSKTTEGLAKLKEERRRWKKNDCPYYYRSAKMIYGDKAASKESNEELDRVLVYEMHYTRSSYDPCLYWYEPMVHSEKHRRSLKRARGKQQNQATHGVTTDTGIPEVHMVAAHVDDLGHHGDDEDMTWFESELAKYFKIGKAEDMTSFLGMSVDQDVEKATVHVSQPGLMLKLEANHGHLWKDRRTPTVPLPPGTELDDRATDEEFNDVKDQPYANIVSSLAYGARMSALHLALPVALLSRHMSKWNSLHMELAVRVAHYAVENKHRGITFCGYGNGNNSDCMFGPADASFGVRTILAHFLIMNGAPFDHGISTARCATISTTDAELRAAMVLARKVKGWRLLLNEMPIRFKQDKPTTCEGDCSPAVTIVNNPGALGDATRHLKKAILFMRECVATQITCYLWTPTRFMRADIGTKALTRPLHDEHLAELSGTAQANDWKRLKDGGLQHVHYESIMARHEQEQRRAARPAKAKKGKLKGNNRTKLSNLESFLKRQRDETHLNLSACDDVQVSILQAQRLGFMSNKRMKMLRDMYEDFSYPADLKDHTFLATLRAGFPKSTHKNLEKAEEFRVWKPCEHLCVDAFELSHRTIHGGRWGYVFTDHKASKKRFVMLARSKAQYPRVLMRLLGKVKSLGWEVKVLRCDGAGELVGEPARHVMDHHDNIQLEVSSPRQPQENGASERAVRSITETARALMMNAPHLPLGCGGLAVLHASLLLELNPIRASEELLEL